MDESPLSPKRKSDVDFGISPSPDKRVRLGGSGGLFSIEGGHESESGLNFNMFVESALSPLSGHYGHDSPSMRPPSQRSIGSDHGPPLDNSQLSLSIPTSRDWSPSVGGSLSMVAGSEFKVCFNDTVGASLGLSSPSAPPRMRHKQRMQNEMDTLDPVVTHEHFRDNKQALARRMKDSYSSNSSISEDVQGDDYERLGIAESPLNSHSFQNQRQMYKPASAKTEPIQEIIDDGLRRSGRSKTPTAYSVEGEFDVGGEARNDRAFSRGRTPKSAMSVSSGDSNWTRSSAMKQTPSSSFASKSQAMTADFYSSTTIVCNCKKSRCLKLYCECLHALKFCENCNCYDCENTAANAATRDDIIDQIRERNPDAFAAKVQFDPRSASKGHLSGCHCKKSHCLKKYCECFAVSPSVLSSCLSHHFAHFILIIFVCSSFVPLEAGRQLSSPMSLF